MINKKYINNIIGQEDLVKRISRIFSIFISTKSAIKPNFIITGESGSGKTFVVEQLTKAFNLPMISINASQITKEGISGNSLSKVLKPISSYKGREIVCFVDEFDKLFITGNGTQTTQPEISSVQNELLKIVEGNTTEVYDDYGKYMTIDISKVLFIFAGAFNGDDVNIPYLLNAGVKTEFLGRISLIFNTDKIDLDLVLDNLSNNKLLKNYCRLYKQDIETVLKDINPYIKKYFYLHKFGLRFINTTIHQYFIYDMDINELEKLNTNKKETEEIEFSDPLINLNVDFN